MFAQVRGLMRLAGLVEQSSELASVATTVAPLSRLNFVASGLKRSYPRWVSITVNLPDELAAPLAAAAAARGVGVEQIAAELVAEGLAGQGAPDPLESFLAAGASGQREPLDIRQLRQDLAARTSANDI